LIKTRSPRPQQGRRRQRKHQSSAAPHRQQPTIPLNEEGVPAAVPDAPRPSPVVFVSAESLARYPWLPPRVIAGSLWRGPKHERVKVDEQGNAAPP
jgi:hypothetical protein